MTRQQIARLVLILIIAVTISVGLGKVGRAAWVDRSTPAVATMCVLLMLFAVAVVVWAASVPVGGDARPWAVLVREAETTTVMGTVGPVWPDGSAAALPTDPATEPILFTHEPMFRVYDDGQGLAGAADNQDAWTLRGGDSSEFTIHSERWFGGVITEVDDETMIVRASDGTEVTIGRHRGGIPVSELLKREGGQP